MTQVVSQLSLYSSKGQRIIVKRLVGYDNHSWKYSKQTKMTVLALQVIQFRHRLVG
jgi:hypothetical protein